MTPEQAINVVNDRREITKKIKEDLIDRLQLDYEVDDIDDDTFLFGSGLSLDSIDAMEIVVGMQSLFDVFIPDGDLSSIRTINTLTDFIIQHRDIE